MSVDQIPSTRPKPFVFVLMPFSEDFDDVYRLGIKPAVENGGGYAERVDDQIFEGSILHRIYNQISKADIIVADVSGKNPNVFYEVGYAHALGKNVILITQTTEDIPFDLKHFTHIIYGKKISNILPEIELRVRWYVDNDFSSARDYGQQIGLYHSGKELDLITIHSPLKEIDEFDIVFSLNNSEMQIVREVIMSLGFVTSSRIRRIRFIPSEKRLKRYILPEGGFFHQDTTRLELLPGEWKTFRFRFRCAETPLNLRESETIVIKLLTQSGSINFPTTITFKESEVYKQR